MANKLPLVTVVIPVYNYGGHVHRAIESVKSQTVSNFDCFIVDDGSTDNTKKAVLDAIEGDDRFHYVYQDNSGVANARNKGVFMGKGKYVCCLDADDALKPQFLEACVIDLEKDRELAIAYTGLWYIKPDGSEGLSKWPGEFSYDEQLKGQNQIPTCNVARREVWERLGGQRQRYAPLGAGEEDAEMWLRAGAYGFKAKKVTDAGLFVYSWLSGRVSGSQSHKAIDWRSWHPWVEDNRHPFVSEAKPERFSHPVRQYDSPTVSIVIPVGEGHEEKVRDALDSLEAQDFRRWEVILAWDSKNSPESIKKVYPYVRVIQVYDNGSKGAGAARNAGVSSARAGLILFLDADDWLNIGALSVFVNVWDSTGYLVYSDYYGRARPSKEDLEKNKDRVVDYNERTGVALIRHESLSYDCERAKVQPDIDLYIWNLVTTLVPKEYHDAIGGFDESMESWEDWDYFIRMAKAGYCFYRIPEPLVTYRFDTGHRRQKGMDVGSNLIRYMRDKYRSIKTMGCNCGKNKTAKVPSGALRNVQPQEDYMPEDKDMVMADYTSPNRGQHTVIGSVSGTRYGYRSGGERFLVDKRDVRANPHLFRPVEPMDEPRRTFDESKRLENERQPEPPPRPIPHEEPPVIEREERRPVDVPLDSINGISTSMIPFLNELGIYTVTDVIRTPAEKLVAINGIGEKSAYKIIQNAMKMTGLL